MALPFVTFGTADIPSLTSEDPSTQTTILRVSFDSVISMLPNVMVINQEYLTVPGHIPVLSGQ